MVHSNSLSTPAGPPRSASHASSMNSETPLKQNMSSTNVFIKGNLDEQRKAVRRDLGPVPEVTVDFMLEHILPNSQVDVTATMQFLKKKEIWSETKGWSDFGGATPKELSKRKPGAPSGSNNKETEVFLRLKDVYGKIVSSAQFTTPPNRPPTLSFEQYPNTAPVSDTAVRTRPDGCGTLRKEQAIHSFNARPRTPHKLNWFDIACVEEYKLDNEVDDINDNIWKILWSLHHIMHVDHRRRFTFGLTIENQMTRIWFCCRQIVLVSQPFNFIEEASKLVHIIASLAYASPTQLGYDPTMSLVWRYRGWHYDIKVITVMPDGTQRTRIYKTFRVISNSAYNIRGRATRVYEAHVDDLNPDNHFISHKVVLKDSWIDVGRPKEGDTLAILLKGAAEEEKQLFLTVLQHGVVQIDGQDDSTEDLILNGQTFFDPTEMAKTPRVDPVIHPLFRANEEILPTPKSGNSSQPKRQATPIRIFPLHHYSKGTSAATSKKSQTSTGRQPITSDALPHQTHRVVQKPIVYSPKVHYRIAFEEKGESLIEMADLGKLRTVYVDQALRDTTLALRHMARRGYVHRDVSAGNIIFYEGRAKLADLEFAKEYGAGQSSYVRTGTYSFMAGEVARGRYTYNPNFKEFAHNPIHDLESLWWVGVWCMMWHYPVPEHEEIDPEKMEHINLMIEHGKALFPSYHVPGDNTRILEISSSTSYASRGATGYSEPIIAMLVRLNDIRQCISWAHMKTQKQLPRVSASYFTEVLRIADPVDNKTDDEDNDPIGAPIERKSIYRMIGAKLNQIVGGFALTDQLLWPLHSIDDHSKWLKTQAKPKRHNHGHGIVNMDEEEVCFDS